jgi:hypothetical protein
MITETDLAWAAGFFDGEGYVTIGRSVSKYKDKTYHGYYLRVGINHVAPEPLIRFQRLFGGKLVKDVDNRNLDGCSRKKRTQWTLQETKAVAFLDLLYPYLYNKDKVADVAFEFSNTRGIKGKPVPDEVRNKRQELKERLMELNGKD